MALDVADAGCGIEKKDREKIFLPFYSTKSEGTGLGLPIVKKIVEAHGGNLYFYSNKGKGVTFRVQLPLLSAGA
jgi:two-component system sensor histidine kinase HydH